MVVFTYRCCSVLLVGLAAWAYWRQRGGLGVPLLWTRGAGALAGAGSFAGLALLHLAVIVRIGRWNWNPTGGSEPAAVHAAVALVGFLFAYVGVLSLVLNRWPRYWVPTAFGMEPERKWRALRLWAGLGAALYIPWCMLHDLGPKVLGYAGFSGWIGYAGLTCEPRPPDVVALLWLAILAGVTAILWRFQYLWDATIRAREVASVLPLIKSGRP